MSENLTIIQNVVGRFDIVQQPAAQIEVVQSAPMAVDIFDGKKGDTGLHIDSIVRTSGTGAQGSTDTYTITMSDGSTMQFQVYQGKDGHAPVLAWSGDRIVIDGVAGPHLTYTPVIEWNGDRLSVDGKLSQALAGTDGNDGVGIESIVRANGTGAAGTIDTYAVNLTDGSYYNISVYNGADGADGEDGRSPVLTWSGDQISIDGTLGPHLTGATGVGIASVARTSGNGAAGTTDTYTITFTDTSTSTFTVYNGTDGAGSGDMAKATYDPDGDGKVVAAVSADSVPWTGVQNPPATYAPSAHDHDGVYQPVGSYSLTSHDHAGVYQPAGSYALAGHDHAGVYQLAGSYSLSSHDHAGVYQPLDGDLTSIAGLAGTSGLLKKTGANTWTLDTGTYLTSASSLDPSKVTQSASYRFTTDAEKSTWNGKEGAITKSAGYAKWTGSAWSFVNETYSLSSHTHDYSATYAALGHNHNGVYQPVDADLTAIAGLAGTSGFLKKTAADTWTLDTTTYSASNHTHDYSASFAPAAHVGATGAAHGAASGTVSGFMSSSHFAKLEGVEAGANNYTHPASHPPSIITQDASNRFVTDAEKTTWNAKQAALGFTPAQEIHAHPEYAVVEHTHAGTYQPYSPNLEEISGLNTTGLVARNAGGDFTTVDTTTFSSAGHTHSGTYLPLTGGTLSGGIKTPFVVAGGTSSPWAPIESQGSTGQSKTESVMALRGYGTTDQARMILNHNAADLAAIGTNANGGWWIGKCDSPYVDAGITKHINIDASGNVSVPVALSVAGSAVVVQSTLAGYSVSTHNHDGVYAASSHDHTGTYQPVDADLTAIAGLAGTSGVLTKTAANTWTLDEGVMFSAYKSATAQTPAINTNTKVVSFTEEYDIGGGFDGSKFQPSVAGYYQINARVGYAANVTTPSARIFKNGSVHKVGSIGNGAWASIVSSLVYLNGTTDYVEIYTMNGTGGVALDYGGEHQIYFNGYLVRRG